MHFRGQTILRIQNRKFYILSTRKDIQFMYPVFYICVIPWKLKNMTTAFDCSDQCLVINSLLGYKHGIIHFQLIEK